MSEPKSTAVEKGEWIMLDSEDKDKFSEDEEDREEPVSPFVEVFAQEVVAVGSSAFLPMAQSVIVLGEDGQHQEEEMMASAPPANYYWSEGKS